LLQLHLMLLLLLLLLLLPLLLLLFAVEAGGHFSSRFPSIM
jgi:hypothetical protein